MKSCWTIKYINYHHAETIWLFSPWDGKTVRIGLTSVVVLRASCIYSGVMSICHSLMNAFMFFFSPRNIQGRVLSGLNSWSQHFNYCIGQLLHSTISISFWFGFPLQTQRLQWACRQLLIRYKLGAIKVSNLTEYSTDWNRKCYKSNWQFTYTAFQRWAFYQEKRGVTEGNTKRQEARL